MFSPMNRPIRKQMLIDVNPEDFIEFGWEAVTSRTLV